MRFTLLGAHPRRALRRFINTRWHFRRVSVPRLHSDTFTVLMGCERCSVSGFIYGAVGHEEPAKLASIRARDPLPTNRLRIRRHTLNNRVAPTLERVTDNRTFKKQEHLGRVVREQVLRTKTNLALHPLNSRGCAHNGAKRTRNPNSGTHVAVPLRSLRRANLTPLRRNSRDNL